MADDGEFALLFCFHCRDLAPFRYDLLTAAAFSGLPMIREAHALALPLGTRPAPGTRLVDVLREAIAPLPP